MYIFIYSKNLYARFDKRVLTKAFNQTIWPSSVVEITTLCPKHGVAGFYPHCAGGLAGCALPSCNALDPYPGF